MVLTIETTPEQAPKVENFADVLPRGSRVFVAFIPGERPQAIVELAGRLVAEGMIPVPHIAARNLLSHGDLECVATALYGAGARQALRLAGGADDAAGSLTSSLELLESGVMEGLGLEQLFGAGDLERSADIDAAGLAAALARENAYARRTGMPVAIVTQFGFDSHRVLAWARAIGWGELIRDVHFHPCGGFEWTTGWAASVASGAFAAHKEGRGFTVQSRAIAAIALDFSLARPIR